jgi:uncharacterized phage infection (PIP) family protein YhgE
MTTEQDAFRAQIVAAVQAELDRHARVVMAETDKIRADAAKEREQMRDAFGNQLSQLAAAVEQGQTRNEQFGQKLRTAFETAMQDRLAQQQTAVDARVAESEARTARRVEEMGASLDTLVAGAARPLLQQVSDDQEAVHRKVESMAENLRRFDEQAARMVTFFNETNEQTKAALDTRIVDIQSDVERRVLEVSARVEEADAAALRRHTETSQLVTQRATDIEDRINQRVLTFETRIKEDTGSRLADMDAHIGKVSAGLDDTLTVLNDRMAKIETWLQSLDDRLERAREEFAAIDQNAIDELKAQMSTAVGEAMLVRIEMERLERGTNDKFDKVAVRVTEVEAALADATMDVSTAVQLERLEELERAVMELDPNKFVLKQESERSGHGAA